MSFKIVIPARYASSRLPGKPLLVLAGEPMIKHVWARAIESDAQQVVVATDDPRIMECCKSFGAEVCQTQSGHESGTDRIAEVAALFGWSGDTLVVNLQGDEPLMPAANLRQVATLLDANPNAGVATLCTPITDSKTFHDPNVVKVVRDAVGRALYFSRSAIPYCRDYGRDEAASLPAIALRHLGLYAYRVTALQTLAATPPCAAEMIERLEQLRALWLGIEIHVAEAAEQVGPGVDTTEDVAIVEQILNSQQGKREI